MIRLLGIVALAALLSCDRERRDFDASNVGTGNAYAMGEGKRLFSEMNCVGCHAHGGGAIGPSLMDDAWIYGSRPADVYATIAGGRPNGMPAYGDRLPSDRIWWLTAYVRSLSGLGNKAARPGRSDHMHVREPEVMTQPAPRREGLP